MSDIFWHWDCDGPLSHLTPLRMNRVSITNYMLEYCKTILQKISFSKPLFKKEYKKTFKYLNERERMELRKWLKANVVRVPQEQPKPERPGVNSILMN